MEIVKSEGEQERNLLIGLIMSGEFCQQMKPILDTRLLQARGSRWVAEKCVQHHDRYEDAPGMDMQAIFDSHRERLPEEDQEYVERLLLSLSQQVQRWDNFNVTYYSDLAEVYLQTKKIERLMSQLQGDLNDADIPRAENRIATFERVGRPKGEAVDAMDPEVIRTSLSLHKESAILQFSGVLGKLVGPFRRGDLIAFAAPMKRGKSWWLLHTAMMGYLEGFNVLFVSLEMLTHQVVSRLASGTAARPTMGEMVEIPEFVGEPETKNITVEIETEKRKPLSYDDSFQKAQAMKVRMAGNGSLRILTFPQDTLSVSDLSMHLENMEHFDKWVPDIICVDYADIMAPEPSTARLENRHKLDGIWKGLRRMAQERNILMATATQTGKITLTKDTHTGDVAEDVRKVAHVSKLIGLNQKDFEKEKKIMRVNVLADRHEFFNPSRYAVVTQSLDIGKPILDSQWKDNLNAEVLNDPDPKRRRKGA